MSRKIRLKNIYLQNYFEDFGYYDDGCTWCEDKINDEDIEYILQSEYDKLRAENEKLREALREIVELYKPPTRSLTAIKMCMVAEQALKEVETCPECGGSCSIAIMVDGGMQDFPCPHCAGSGEV